MGLIKTSSGMPAIDIEPGTYPATLVGVKQITIQVDGDDKTMFEWTFDLGEGLELSGLTSLFTGPKSKTWKFLVALLGAENVKVDQDFDPADLIGKSALVTVEPNRNGYPRVTEVVAPPRTRRAPVAAGVQAAAAGPDRQTVRAAAGVEEEGDLPF
jgi:hypothetical protein